MFLLVVSISAVAVALAAATYAWRIAHAERLRSDARVAALAAAIDGTSGEATSMFERAPRSGLQGRPLLKVGVGFAMAVLVIVLIAMSGDRHAPAADQARATQRTESTQSLELLSMRHVRAGDNLTVTGLVRNRGAAAPESITAVVFVFDRDGGFVASGRAPLEFNGIAAWRRIAISGHNPGREGRGTLRVSFRTDGWHRPARGSPRDATGLELRAAMRIQTLLAALSVVTAAAVSVSAQDGFRFRSGVELVNVTATVTDDSGRFVSGLRKEDFTVYDDDVRQEVTYFSNDRVPVSLGILLDASGSMTSDKMATARAAIDRFIYDLLGKDDELFFMEFASNPRVTQQWTRDRKLISRALARVSPSGGTAMYDAVADGLPLASAGENRKKALLVISDGNDTNSDVSVSRIAAADSRERGARVRARRRRHRPQLERARDDTAASADPDPVSVPVPRGRRPVFPQTTGGIFNRNTNGERVNADALRQMTDDTGGRTEIVRGFDGLDAATARIADELSKQYSLGYSNSRREGRPLARHPRGSPRSPADRPRAARVRSVLTRLLTADPSTGPP